MKLKFAVRRMASHFQQSGLHGPVRLIRALFQRRAGNRYTNPGNTERLCPCCGWQGRRFLPYISGGYVTFDAVCPTCDSHSRHRAHRLFYDAVMKLPESSGTALYFSPEQGILPYLRNLPSLDILTTGYDRDDVDTRTDIQALPFADASFHLILCHRVIEHVPDDRCAMRELLRILKPGGQAVLSVPITPSLSQTIEYGKPNPLEDDHYYEYALDFQQRIPLGFDVTRYDSQAMFSTRQRSQLALHSPDFIFVCTKPLT